MKILVIGAGAREHAIAEAIAKSNQEPELYALMGRKNPGIARLCKDFLLESETSIVDVVDYAVSKNIELAVIGPEAPLELGLADALGDADVLVVGPNKDAAQIECDKAWTRRFMRDHSMSGCPKFGIFESVENAFEFIDELEEVAVKPPGLTGGKGVKVMGSQIYSKEEAKEYARELIKKGKVVIEEKLEGEEFTLQAFVDGRTLIFSPSVQDYKRAYEGDTGPNTGGMGSYSDASEILPFMTEQDYDKAKRIMRYTVFGIKKSLGVFYRGILYGQFMLTADGIKLVEFNARFGDPEAMNILPLLKTDFVEILERIATGKLSNINIEFEKKATVCKYAVPKGYPENPITDSVVEVGDLGDAKLYYASVYEENGKVYTTGSRAIAVVGIADTINEAEQKAEFAISNIKGELYCRHDIGTASSIKKRIDHIKSLRKL
ncbi:MAG TPA: phosphoribosylamine--glycine ligase [Methanosarcinales archaeon]|nr:phosphoribosylamine--glycine ligase [Methanosarcinales archaeon]